jgi:nicotinamidase-related amidase
MEDSDNMLKIENAVLLVIDIQEKLWKVMHEKEALKENAQKLIKGMNIMNVPVILTEQNPKGIGPTLPDISELMEGIEPLIKFTFSCCKEPPFMEKIQKINRRQFLICGIETHICVYQTALELMKAGYEVYVVADAVTSRSAFNKDVALSRLQSEGVKLTVTEMAIYELMETAKSPHFKPMLQIIK